MAEIVSFPATILFMKNWLAGFGAIELKAIFRQRLEKVTEMVYKIDSISDSLIAGSWQLILKRLGF